MTAHVTYKITRPSLNHYFYYEYIDDTGVLLKSPVRLMLEYPRDHFEEVWVKQNKNFDGLIKSYSDEFISWEDIYKRKNELRPDLKIWLEKNHFNIEKNSQRLINDPFSGPLFNPFSLTFTIHYIFVSMEHAIELSKAHKSTFTRDQTDNIIEYYINSDPYDIFN
jgi:hypothetical protein